MPTDEATPNVDYASALNDHYGVSNLSDEILDAFAEAGTDVDELTRDDIVSFDEFHIRGIEATRELAVLAGLDERDGPVRVLDVGCGVGGPARTLAGEFGCEVVGIDLVETYCNAAELFTDHVGLSDAVSFRQADALDLPFADDTFDVVWFEHTLMNVADTERAFAEARRVLGPGGSLALYEICAGPGGETIFPVPWASDASLSYLASPTQYREWLLDCGFEEVAWQDITGPSLAWFRDVVASMASRPADAPPPLGINLLMGEDTPTKARNVVQNLEEDRIVVVQGVYESVSTTSGSPSATTTEIDW